MSLLTWLLTGLALMVGGEVDAAVAPFSQDFSSASTPGDAGFTTSGYGTWSIAGGALNVQGSVSGGSTTLALTNVDNAPGADFTVTATMVINSQSSPPSGSSSTAIRAGLELLRPTATGGSPAVLVDVMTTGWGGNNAGNMRITGLGTGPSGENESTNAQFNDTIAPLQTGAVYTLTAEGIYNTNGTLTVNFTLAEAGGPSTTISTTITNPPNGIHFGFRKSIAIWNTTSGADISFDNYDFQGGNSTTPGGGTLTALLNIRPNMGLYKPGESPQITFDLQDATGAQSDWELKVAVRDEKGAQIGTTASYNVLGSTWPITYNAPNAGLGFYRVYASIYDGSGTEITKLTHPNASRLNGILTYAVVPDPTTRPASIPDAQAVFGMQGGFHSDVGTDIYAFLGCRWNMDGGWKWRNLSPSYGSPFDGTQNVPPQSQTWATDGAGGAWPVYIMPNLTKDGRPYGGSPDVYKAGTFEYNTGALKDDPMTEDYRPDWSSLCTNVARPSPPSGAQSYPIVYSNRSQYMYEITWEPIQPWGYKGTDEDLVEMYQLAHDAISAADPTAWTVGPCMHVNSLAGLTHNYELFDLGLGDHIDAFSAHPYMDHDIATSQNPFNDPERAGQPNLIRTMKNKIRGYVGQEIPMIGTEQGYRTRLAFRDNSTDQVTNQPPLGTQPNFTNELNQARRLIRAQLMTLGEGWKVNIAFYIADYPTRDTLDENYYWDWGFFYNLDTPTSDGYGPKKIGPKPVAAAYAAMTHLLENRFSTRDINWLGDSVRGYAYEDYDDSSDVVLALWDFNREPDNPRQVTIDTGVGSVDVYDWMGNKTTQSTTGGLLTVDLSREPIYIKGVEDNLWGSAAPDRNVARSKTVTASSEADPTNYPVENAVDGDSVSYLSRWLSVDDISAAKSIEVDLGGSYEINEVRFWTGRYQSGWYNNYYQQPLESYNIDQWNGSAWVNIVSRTGNTDAVVAETFTPVTTSKVRLTVPAWSVNQVMLYELEVLTTAILPPVAPSNLAATAVSSSQIDLSWTDNANNETGFEVDRAANSTFTTDLVTDTVGPNVTTYNATGLSASTTYYFRVRAVNTGGASANSNTASGTTSSGSGGTFDLLPTDDTYVNSNSVSTNYGTSTILRARGNPTQETYLTFDLSGVSGTVASATLTLYVTYIDWGTNTHQIAEANNDTWDESTVTWSTRPNHGTAFHSWSLVNNQDEGAYVQIDVTSQVQAEMSANELLSLCIFSSNSQYDVRYASKEHATAAFQPVLSVTTSGQ